MKDKLLVIGVLLCWVSCSKMERTQQEQAPVKVKTMAVSPQASSINSRYVGTIEAAQETPLSLQTPGRVVTVAVQNGQRVAAGQTILAVDNTQALNALESAKATLQHAQDGFDRVSKVHEKGVVSDQKMVEIESQLQQARSLYAAAQRQLEECTLTAPRDGIISGLEISNGQTILPGTILCTLLDVRSFRVRFTVPETEINGLGKKGEVSCAAVEQSFPITITERNYSANALTHTYEVVARIDGDAEGLQSGMVATVKVRSERFKEEEIVIPAKCILLKPEGPTVWVAEQGRAVRRNITIDGYKADGVRVRSGLQENDTLIVEGYQKLYKGCKIENE